MAQPVVEPFDLAHENPGDERSQNGFESQLLRHRPEGERQDHDRRDLDHVATDLVVEGPNETTNCSPTDGIGNS